MTHFFDSTTHGGTHDPDDRYRQDPPAPDATRRAGVVTLMGAATVLIGLLPTYATIGGEWGRAMAAWGRRVPFSMVYVVAYRGRDQLTSPVAVTQS